MVTQKAPVVLISLDGWGIRESRQRNAIKQAKTPHLDALWRDFPHAKLKASGMAVGLPEGFIGNSEVGHLHMGAGQLIPHYLLQINRSIKDGSFSKNKELLRAMGHVRKNKSALHIMGLVGDAGVHAHQGHIRSILRMAKAQNIKEVYIHAILDGRDNPPGSAGKYLNQIRLMMKRAGIGMIAGICGRYYAMDRDTRWDRTEKAYKMIAQGIGLCTTSVKAALHNAAKRKETDEFVRPTLILPKGIHRVPRVHDNDAVIFYNYRSDRARQLTRAFVDKVFMPFKRTRLKNIHFTCFTKYDENIDAPIAFPPPIAKNILGEVLSKKGLSQMRIAETEKYAHVTFFFNNGRETPFLKEDRILIHSPRVATYDSVPEMSAKKTTKAAIKTIASNKHQFILINFANADMVGHTGKWCAAMKACEVVDDCVGEIVGAVLQHGGHCIITADHGNAEDMTPKHVTSHTQHRVPFILVNNEPEKNRLYPTGTLQNVAPTVLDLLGIKIPNQMGRSMRR